MQIASTRPFENRDAQALAELFHQSVHVAGTAGYSPEQLAAWSPAVPDANEYVKRAEEYSVFVAEDAEGSLAGYGVVTATGYIDHLYCRADLTRTGVGSALYAAMEEAAIMAGTPQLSVDASETARYFFEHHGFELQFRRDFTLGDVPIHHYRMLKTVRADSTK